MTSRLLRTPSVRELALLLLAFAIVAACHGDDAVTPSGSTPPLTAPDTSSASGATVDSAAHALYDAVSSQGDVSGALTSILGSFTTGGASDDTILARLGRGEPVVLDAQIAQMADAYAAGELIRLDSFFSAVDSQGVTTVDGSAPLTRAYASSHLAGLVGKATLAHEEILPALVLALGRERARRSAAGVTDPVWGDDYLDPLQTTLLLYNLYFASTRRAAPSVTTVAPAVPTVLSAARLPSPRRSTAGQSVFKLFVDKATGYIQANAFDKVIDFFKGKVEDATADKLGMPVTKNQAAKATVCLSTLLYSYHYQIAAAPPQINHHQADDPSVPWESLLTATLTFNFTPKATVTGTILSFIGCPLPPNGPAAGKPVTWTVNQPLSDHGALVSPAATTDQSGAATATYQAIDEVVPKALRVTLRNEVTGTVDVAAGNLVPDKWSTLEKVVELVRSDVLATGVRLFVRYYTPPAALLVDFDSDIQGTIGSNGTSFGSFHSHVQALGVVLDTVFAQSSGKYLGKGPLDYPSFSLTVPDCSAAVTALNPEHAPIVMATEVVNGALALVVSSLAPTEQYTLTCPKGGSGPTAGAWFATGYGQLHPEPETIMLDPGSPGAEVGQKSFQRTMTTSVGTFTETTTFRVRAAP